MWRIRGNIPLILWSVIALYSTGALGQATESPGCPNIGTLRYEAAKYVAEFFREEADRVQGFIEQAIANKRNAKQALQTCYAELESAKSLKNARVAQAAKLAKDVQRLESQKAAAEAARDQSKSAFNQAKPPHTQSFTDAARARQEAEEAVRKANQRAKEAAEAWAAANAAQQSTKWVPATNGGHHRGHQPTSVKYGTPDRNFGGKNVAPGPPQVKVAPDAAKLTEKAKAAEYAAAVAQAEAKRLTDLARAADEASRSVWDKMSPSANAYHQAEAQYDALCLSYAQSKASYDAAILAINDAVNLIFAKQAALDDAKARIKAEAAKIEPLKTQLATILAVANYAQALAEKVKEETYSTTTMEMTTTEEATTTEMPTTEAPVIGPAAPLNGNSLIPEDLNRRLQEALANANRALLANRRQSVPAATGAAAAAVPRRAPARAPSRSLGASLLSALSRLRGQSGALRRTGGGSK